MSIWIRAICCASIADANPDELREHIFDSDFEEMAETDGLPRAQAEEAEEALRIETTSDSFDVWLLHYRSDPDHFIRIERWAVPEEVSGEVGELIEFLEDEGVATDVDRIRGTLARAVETVALELKLSDVESIGWQIALCAAGWLAKLGRGLLVADGPESYIWYDPATWDELCVAKPSVG